MVLAVAALAAAFFIGRASVATSREPVGKGAFRSGYLAGREAAFAVYDGGWGYGEPYIVVLRRGGRPEITYAFAQRWPMKPGTEYRACGGTICTRPER